MTLPWPWSVPPLPFSRTVRPNSDITTTTVSRQASPDPRASAARPSPSGRSLFGQLPLVVALVDVRVPAAEPDHRQADAGVAPDQPRKPRRLSGEAGGRRRAVVGDLPLVASKRRSAAARAVAALAIGSRRGRHRPNRADRRRWRPPAGRAAAAWRRPGRAAEWRPAPCPPGFAARSGRWLIASVGPRGPGSASSRRFIQPSRVVLCPGVPFSR